MFFSPKPRPLQTNPQQLTRYARTLAVQEQEALAVLHNEAPGTADVSNLYTDQTIFTGEYA